MPRRQKLLWATLLGVAGALLFVMYLLLSVESNGAPTALPEVQTVIAAYPEFGSWEDRLTQEAQVQTQIALAYPYELTARFETPPTFDLRSPTSTPPVILQPTLTSTPIPTPTPLLPTLNPTQLAGLPLSLRRDTTTALNGRSLLKLTGLAAGLRSSGYCQDGPYRWLDNEHLLLYPITGLEDGMGISEYTLPLVVSLTDTLAWQPPSDGHTPGCSLLLWSDPLSRLIVATRNEIVLLTPAGERVRELQNDPNSYYSLSLSPSGKRLATGLAWHDFETGEAVNWTLSSSLLDKGGIYHWSLYGAAWSADEKRLFSCCFAYADATEGTVAAFQPGQLRLVGRGVPAGFSGSLSRWVLNDTRVMVEYDFYDDNRSVIPLIDPVAGLYQDVRLMAGLTDDGYCGAPSIAPDGNRLIAMCGQHYLIELQSWITYTLPANSYVHSWSPDSRFILLAQTIDPQKPLFDYALMAAGNGEVIRIADSPIVAPVWSPSGAQLAFLRADGQALIITDLNDASVFQVNLPVRANQVVWNRQGTELAVVAGEESLWWVSEVGWDRVEQLTLPLPAVRDVRWSPSGARLAFVSGLDVYVLDVLP